MGRTRLRSCFILAPFGTDTSVLREVLEEQHVKWSDQTRLPVASSWVDAMEREVRDADFVCAVLTPTAGSNTFFELGVAHATRKPILTFVSPAAQKPFDLLHFAYIRAEPTNRTLITDALKTFLEHAGESRRPRRASPKRSSPSSSASISVKSGSPRAFERMTADLLSEAGFIVSEQHDAADRGLDLAVWSDVLQSSLGSPILVEIKRGDVRRHRSGDAVAQVRRHLEQTQARAALIIHWDATDLHGVTVEPGWPLVFRLDGASLKQLVANGKLVEELRRLRNRALHGAL